MAGTNQPTTKGGNIILRRVSVPDQVDPGDPYEVDVEVSNGAWYIDPWDPDACIGSTHDGYKLEVVLTGPNGEKLTKGPVCHTRTQIGTKDETYSFTVEAPQSGRAEVSAYVEMEKSGKRTDALEASTVVSSTPAEQPDEGNDNNDGDGNPSDPFGDADGDGVMNALDPAPQDPSKPSGDGNPLTPDLSTTQKAALAGAGLLLVLAVARPYASLGAEVAG